MWQKDGLIKMLGYCEQGYVMNVWIGAYHD
jgi:hypothetical protein